MARNPAKQFNLGIHKIPSFRFHLYKKHTIPPKTRGFNPQLQSSFFHPWPGLPVVSAKRHVEVWPWARLTARIPRKLNWTMQICLHPKTPRKEWSGFFWLHFPKLFGCQRLPTKKGKLEFPVIKGGFTRLWDVLSPCEFYRGRCMSGFGAPKQTKWWRDKGGILKRYGKAKVFAQREGRSCWKKMRDHFGGEDFVCVCMYLVTRCGQEPLPSWCFVPIWFVFWRLSQTPLFSWCIQIFSQLKNSVLTILRKNIIKEFQTISYHISLQCLKFGFSLPPWTTPNNNPQKSSCFLVGSDTNQPPSVFRWISLAFREFFGFNAFRLHSTKMSKQKGQHRHRNFISKRNR